ERVKLVEQSGMRGQVRLEPRAGLFVTRGRADQAVAREDPARVRVGDKHRAACSIEKDGVGCLRPESLDVQEASSKRYERRRPQAAEISAHALDEPVCQREDPARLDAWGPGRSDHAGQEGRVD